MQPVWAGISDAFGRKPPLYVCVVLFLIGSIIFALAQNMNTVIAARVLQGFGGGGIDVLTQVILADMTTLEERSKYLGLMAVPSAVGNIMGPSVGGLFTNVCYLEVDWMDQPAVPRNRDAFGVLVP